MGLSGVKAKAFRSEHYGTFDGIETVGDPIPLDDAINEWMEAEVESIQNFTMSSDKYGLSVLFLFTPKGTA